MASAEFSIFWLKLLLLDTLLLCLSWTLFTWSVWLRVRFHLETCAVWVPNNSSAAACKEKTSRRTAAITTWTQETGKSTSTSCQISRGRVHISKILPAPCYKSPWEHNPMRHVFQESKIYTNTYRQLAVLVRPKSPRARSWTWFQFPIQNLYLCLQSLRSRKNSMLGFYICIQV